MALFKKTAFDNYWFETETPAFLVKMIKKENMLLQDLKEIYTKQPVISKYQISDISIIPILFQTGYLTIKQKDLLNNIILSYPNKEVENSFLLNLFIEYSESDFKTGLLLVFKML